MVRCNVKGAAALAAAACCSVGLASTSLAAELGRKLEGAMHDGPITAIAVDPGSRFLASASEDKTVRIWDLGEGRLVRTITLSGDGEQGGKAYAVAISPDGERVACGGYTGRKTREDQGGQIYYEAYVYDRASGKLLHRLDVPFLVEGLTYSNDGKYLVVTSRGRFGSTSGDFGADRIFRTKDYTWARQALIEPAGSPITLADFDAKNRLLFVQKFGTWILHAKGDDFNELREIGVPTAISASPDGSRIAIAFADSTVGVYSGEELTLLTRPSVSGIGPAEIAFTDDMDLADPSLSAVAWSGDGEVLYYSGGRTCRDNSCFIRAWAQRGEGAPKDFAAAKARVTDLAALRDGALAYSTADAALGFLDRDGRPRVFPKSKAPEPSAADAATRDETGGGAGGGTGAPAADSDDAAAASPQIEALRAEVAALMAKHAYTDAVPVAEREVELAGQSGGGETLVMARALMDLGGPLSALGNYRAAAGESVLLIQEYRDARDRYGTAADVFEQKLGPEEPETLESLTTLGRLLRAMREYDQASDALQHVYTARRRALGDKDPSTAEAKSDLAAARVMKQIADQRFADAFVGAQAALADAESGLPADHPALALALANLAETHRSLRAADPTLSVGLYERALAIQQRSPASEGWNAIRWLRSLGEIHAGAGRYAEAQEYYERALGAEERALGADHPALVDTLRAVADSHQKRAHYGNAELLYKRVLAIREREDEAFRIANALEELAELYRDMERPAMAQPLYVHALAIREQRQGPNHFKTAETLRSLATVYRLTGAYAKAGPLYERSVAIHSSGSYPLPWALRDLAALAVAQKQNRVALGRLRESLAAQTPILELLFRPNREEDQLAATASRHVSGTYLFFLGLVSQQFAGDEQAIRDAAELVLRRKGIVYDAQAKARVSLGSLPEEQRAVRARLTKTRGEIASLVLQQPQSMDETAYRDKLAVLFQQSGELEKELTSSLARELRASPVTVESVSSALPQGSALVELVKIPHFDFGREDFDFPSHEWNARSRYLAFVLEPAGSVALVDLGPAAELDAAADLALRATRDPRAGEWRGQLQNLYSKLWAPLESVVGDARRILISADGALSLVPFAALIDSKGAFLAERHTIAYVTSGRDVRTAKRPAATSDLLLVANPAFDAGTARDYVGNPAYRANDHVGEFGQLPGTAREAREIPQLVPQHGTRVVLTGKDATESAVKGAAQPRIMHLATHGFFLPDRTLGMVEAQYETPLIRSGLAFAGANGARRSSEGDDGLLTALEISGMDLTATELVVLSACETGVGELRSGEGVFGLRRAFALAGAQNLVMSLWSVEDTITANQIARFYGNLAEMAPAEALRQAQLETIRELEERDGDAAPGLWAPFIVQGGRALGE